MAARFFVVGGVDTNWSTVGNWSLTSGGAGGQAVPAATDDVTLDASSGSACVLNTATAKVAKSIDLTNFTGTLTSNVTLSVSGSVTLGTNVTFAGASAWILLATGTLRSNGKTFAQPLTFNFAGTYTLFDDWTVTGLITFSLTATFSGAHNISCGAMTVGGTTLTVTLSGNITGTGLLTISTGTTCTFAGSFALHFDAASLVGANTIVIAADVTIDNLTSVITGAVVLNGAFNWKTAGLTTTAALSGTTTVVFAGTGTWTGAAGALSNSVTINTAGTLTLSGTVLYLAGTITWTAGTVSAGASILSIGSSCTLNTTGMSWANITLTAAVTITINSLLTVTGTLTMPNAAVTFAGSAGWTVATFTNTTITATRIWTFTAARTYTVTTAFTTVHAAAQTVRFTFTAASSTNFVLGPGATQDVGFVDPTNLNASTGQAIFTYHGVVTTSPNWVSAYPINDNDSPPVYQLGI